MAQAHLTLAAVAVVLILSQNVYAKRGCSAFGHSCFGGHGKRSGDSSAADTSNQELLLRRQMGQEETPPHLVYPHSYSNPLAPGDDIIPIRDGGLYGHEDIQRDAMKYRLRNIVKHWMDSYYRRSQQNDDGYFSENNL